MINNLVLWFCSLLCILHLEWGEKPRDRHMKEHGKQMKENSYTLKWQYKAWLPVRTNTGPMSISLVFLNHVSLQLKVGGYCSLILWLRGDDRFTLHLKSLVASIALRRKIFLCPFSLQRPHVPISWNWNCDLVVF